MIAKLFNSVIGMKENIPHVDVLCEKLWNKRGWFSSSFSSIFEYKNKDGKRKQAVAIFLFF